MVLRMQGAVPRMWDDYLCDDDFEWDYSYNVMYEDYADFANPEVDVLTLLDSGLSRSEALEIISKIEGEEDDYDKVMSDWDSFESLGEFLEFAESAYSYKTYLALTLLERDEDDSSEGESSETRDGLRSVKTMLVEDLEVSSGRLGPVFSPAMGIKSVEDWVSIPWGEGSYFFNSRLEYRPGEGLSALNGISAYRPSEDEAVYVTGRRPVGVQAIPQPNEIGWGGFNGPGSL